MHCVLLGTDHEFDNLSWSRCTTVSARLILSPAFLRISWRKQSRKCVLRTRSCAAAGINACQGIPLNRSLPCSFEFCHEWRSTCNAQEKQRQKNINMCILVKKENNYKVSETISTRAFEPCFPLSALRQNWRWTRARPVASSSSPPVSVHLQGDHAANTCRHDLKRRSLRQNMKPTYAGFVDGRQTGTHLASNKFRIMYITQPCT